VAIYDTAERRNPTLVESPVRCLIEHMVEGCGLGWSAEKLDLYIGYFIHPPKI